MTGCVFAGKVIVDGRVRPRLLPAALFICFCFFPLAFELVAIIITFFFTLSWLIIYLTITQQQSLYELFLT